MPADPRIPHPVLPLASPDSNFLRLHEEGRENHLEQAGQQKAPDLPVGGYFPLLDVQHVHGY